MQDTQPIVVVVTASNPTVIPHEYHLLPWALVEIAVAIALAMAIKAACKAVWRWLKAVR